MTLTAQVSAGTDNDLRGRPYTGDQLEDDMTRKALLEYSRLNDVLLDRFPPFRDRFAELKATNAGEEPGPHVSYDVILVPYIRSLLLAKQDELATQRVFSFLEEMANSSEKIQEVLSVSVLESLLGEKDVVRLAEPKMGPKTRGLAAKVLGG